jgi:uncharacterized protein YjbI with pentapeptide repeats
MRLWRIGYALSACFAVAVAGLALLGWVALVLLHHPALSSSHVISVHDTVGVAQLVFAFVAGAGALVALVVAYRRQRVAEDAASHDRTRVLNERFTAIAAELGDAQAAVRLAGVHAMAGLADDWKENRQTCIDVLCAYLRLPYDPDPGEDAAPSERAAYRANREVRHTIIRLICTHLRSNAAVSWRGLNFDFTGVVFDGGNFTGAEFSGGIVRFEDAVFTSGLVDFESANFSGGYVDFSGAAFCGGAVSFFQAQFRGGRVDFGNAVFSGGEVGFHGAEYSGGEVSFYRAKFTGGEVGFAGAYFAGAIVDFSKTKFSGATVSFQAACFIDGQVNFHEAVFGGKVSFEHAQFRGGEVSFADAGFGGSNVSFTEALFFAGHVSFQRAQIMGGGLMFDRAAFSGARVDFVHALLRTGVVDFSKVADWSHPPAPMPSVAGGPPNSMLKLPPDGEVGPSRELHEEPQA